MNPGLARALGTMLKQDFQRAVLNRDPPDAAPTRRAVGARSLFVCDEYQAFATTGENEPSGDEKFFSLARQARCIPIVATQSISSLRSTLPGESWRTLLQGLRTKIFLALSDDFSAQMAADLCGKVERLKPGYTITEAGQDARVSMLTGRPAAHRTTVSAAKTYSLAARVRVPAEGLCGAPERAGDRAAVRRPQSAAADVLLSEAVLPRRADQLLRPRRRRERCDMSFDVILPFLRPIAHLIQDPDVSEIMVNGSRRVFVERQGARPARSTDVRRRRTQSEGRRQEHRAGAGRRRLGGAADPRLAPARRLARGRRLPAVQPRRDDADDPQVSDAVLHRRRTRAHRHDDAGGAGDACRRRSQRNENILISGGTEHRQDDAPERARGVPAGDDRVVLIEDTAELQIDRPNLVRFEARREQADLPAVTIRDLLRATLRHRPDRIIVGEVRGGEAFDLLQALNTGHAGSLSTIHANSAEQALARFASCVVQSGVELPYQAVRYQIADAIDLVLHLGRHRGARASSRS